jgi:toxin ParE1/3/4
MMRVVLKPRAHRDLEEIWEYTEATWSAAQAEAYVRQIQRACDIIAANPRVGRACDEVRAGYRKYRAGSHFLFYRTVADNIEIVRILHQSRDFDRHL